MPSKDDLGEDPLTHGGEVSSAGQVVRAHELDGLAAEDALTAELAPVGQHQGELQVVVRRRHQAAAAGQERGRCR